MDIHDYLIDHNGFDWPVLLEEWLWLLPAKFNVRLMTRMGDLFIVVPNGTILMLDVGAAELREVAKNPQEFIAKIDELETANDWLMIPIVDALIASGQTLAPGQCYSYKMVPTLGGTYTASNFHPFPIREHFGAWGLVQKQLADLPNGTQVVIKASE